MVKLTGCYLTDAGYELCIREGLFSLTFTRAETGAGVYAEGEDVSQMTALKDARQEFDLTGKTTEGDYCNVIFFLTNRNLETGYDMSEIGLYAEDDEGNEVLYAVAYALPDGTELLPADDGSTPYYSKIILQTKVSRDANVTIEFDVTGHEWTAAYVQQMLDITNGNLAGAFRAGAEYEAGDWCIHENQLYERKADGTPQSWDISEWSRITVFDRRGSGGDVDVATEEEIMELVRELMEGAPVPPGDEIATDEDVEDVIENLDDL